MDESLERALVDHDFRVSVDNDFVMGRMDWSMMMHRLMMVLVSQLDSRNQESFSKQYVYVKDLIEDLSYRTGAYYDAAQAAAERLIREPIEIKKDGTYTAISLFDEITYVRHFGLVVAEFSDKARPYLLRLQRKFTKKRSGLGAQKANDL